MKSGIAPASKAGLNGGIASSQVSAPSQEGNGKSFGEVVSFVNRHGKLHVLSNDRGGASIAVWPDRQGRVLTSTAAGPEGLSFGWVNHELIASGETLRHVNSVGGEDRIWLGPEGGQYSIFFAPGVSFDLEHWYTPAAIDTDPFDIVDASSTSLSFRRAFSLTNYSGARFHVQIDRDVRLLPDERIWSDLGIAPCPGIKAVGFESENKLTNLSDANWSRETGLLSLWVLGQFQSSPQTTIVLPIRAGSEDELGIPVTTDYFGSVPRDRIAIGESAVLFKADARYRSKLGISLRRAKGRLGSYDGQNHVLTVVQYSYPADGAEYVNSAWKIQEHPYQGDVANCYNDGPPSSGGEQLGNFYELESSSPAKALRSHEAIGHVQRTIHLVGAESQLDLICRETLGAGLQDVCL